MEIGEIIALLCKQASNNDTRLMAKAVYSIEVENDGIHLYFTDGNTPDYTINAESE